jgi:hypothetical protein
MKAMQASSIRTESDMIRTQFMKCCVYCRLRWTVAEAELEAAKPRIQQLRSEGSHAERVCQTSAFVRESSPELHSIHAVQDAHCPIWWHGGVS